MMIRNAYRSVVPEPVRALVWKVRCRASSLASVDLRHELRWHLARSSTLEQIIDDRLGPDRRWLFLLGVNNSGTTLLQNVLVSHPGVRTLGRTRDSQYKTRALPTPENLRVPRIWTRLLDTFRWTEDDHPHRARRVKYDWSSIFPSGSGPLFARSPPDTLRSRWLQAHFQPSRFVATFRHPYAVCEGMKRRGGYDIEDCARHWTTANRILLRDLEHLESVMTYTYEDFCESPREVLSQIEAFADLSESHDSTALSGAESHSLEGQTQGIQNLNSRSLERLSDENFKTINQIAGPIMERLGYHRL